MLARYLGFRLSLALFVAVEAALLFLIPDSLILSILMLIDPVEGKGLAGGFLHPT